MIVRQEKKHPKFRISVIFIIILLSFAGCFLYYMKSSNLSDLTENDNVSQEAVAYITSETEYENQQKINNPIPKSEPVESEYLNDCIFIGDSIISNLAKYGLIPERSIMKADNTGLSEINNATVEIKGEKFSLFETLKKSKVKNVYIMLGSDDIARMTNESMLNEYGSFIKTVSGENPDKIIYVISIPPVTVNKENDRASPVLNTAIDSYNAGLLKLANENNICYLDLNAALKSSDGKLLSEFSESDGYNINESGKQKIIEYILSHTYQK
jgi:flagellar basal body-associated protein FliL